PHRCLFFYSPLHLPPPSTLFPYTTLFRSLPKTCRAATGSSRGPAFVPRRVQRTLQTFCRRPDPSRPPPGDRRPPSRPLPGSTPRDRKSTRLNSSHLGISYAVFCLKKKT